MEKRQLGLFFSRFFNKKAHFPFNGQIELTYRCDFKCIHCYCKGSADRARELTTGEWKKTIDMIRKEGCIFLTFTGGEPLVKEDFLEIYSYSKKKGFLITIFTNGYTLTEQIIDYLAKSPPFVIEITLNGITEKTYEAITQVKGSFSKVLENIKKLKEKGISLLLKSNCLKQNKDEIAKVKAFVDKFLGKTNGKFHFKYDPMIYPRVDGDKTPTNYRLSFAELLELRKEDPDIWDEYQRGLKVDFPDLNRDRSFLYRCNSWMTQFFINPYGRLKFCMFSDKFSVDLKTTPFKEGFYNVFPRVLNEKFKTDSKCRDCSLTAVCYHCPARAYLETGDEEAPVPYYCELAKFIAEQMETAHSKPS